MSVVIITGSAGLIGSEAASFFAGKRLEVVGVDNDMRKFFFGSEASTHWNLKRLKQKLGKKYTHVHADIRDERKTEALFGKYRKNIKLVIHCASQPSHDWAARSPRTDFTVNANGTLNYLEATRKHAPEATFIFMSTNKVYGDTPNRLPLVELETRWEISKDHPYQGGITESLSIDQTLHSLFGASKASADLVTQEYGRYFGMRTAVFRGGCLTGPSHSGTVLHGFLAYLMKCAATGSAYQVFGYKAKQVRDNIHSADLIEAFYEVFKTPRVGGEVYNIGGGRQNNCSMLEAIRMCEEITGRKVVWNYLDQNRVGDHIWWVGSNEKFRSHYPNWKQKYDLMGTLREIYESNKERWKAA